MSSTIDRAEHVPVGRVINRGFTAAQAALIGALYLALLHVPLQVVSAINQGVQQKLTFAPGRVPDPEQVLLSLALSGGSFLLGLTVFFLFPLIQGGILGTIHDQLNAPARPTRSFGASARAYYSRLLGSQGLFVLLVAAIMLPTMIVGMFLAIQNIPPEAEPPTSAEIQQRLLANPLFVTCMVLAMIFVTAAGMVYWIACCIVVGEDERVVTSWRRSLRFCRHNLGAVLAVLFLNLVVSVVLAPLGMLGQLGIVTNAWALVGLAVVYSAVVGYWGMVLSGFIMSLYLHRRDAARRPESAMSLAGQG